MTGQDPVSHHTFMPSQYQIKTYTENGYYHVYNRGVEKRDIFVDDQDYRVFLSFLKSYLSPEILGVKPYHPIEEATGSRPVRIRPLKTFFGEVSLLAYCLMPNHFHLLLWQSSMDGMTRFMQSFCTSYSMYFNKKYKRVGTLFQGPYKAVSVYDDIYLLHLTRYIHLNPLEFEVTGSCPVKVSEYPYSSYSYYLGKKQAEWLHPQPVLDFFRTNKRTSLRDFLSYESFVEDFADDSRLIVGKLTIE